MPIIKAVGPHMRALRVLFNNYDRILLLFLSEVMESCSSSESTKADDKSLQTP